MAEATTPVEILCCYSRKDETWLRKLETHLSLLKRQGLVFLWHDRLIAPGADWAKAIDTRLETASVILLLVSADFLASDYCYGIEMKRALERHAAGEARVVPILVRPVDWEGAPFAHLQILPTDAKPIASWRSKERALVDVAAGIRRVIEDVPLLAANVPRVALPSVWNIPYPRNPFFTGRDDELTHLHFRLQAGHATALSQPLAISGLGGIGKTQLAVEYAYRYHHDYQAVLWVRAESAEAIVSSYLAIAELLQLPERGAKDDVIVQAVKTWLQTHRGWLLILDNADDLTLVPAFLPTTPGRHLLLTTRAAATGWLAHKLEVEVMPVEIGTLLLLRRARPNASLEQASPGDVTIAKEISEELGGLPLALEQAGAYIEETGCRFEDYLALYRTHRQALLARRGMLSTDYPHSVATTWLLAFQRVQEANPAAAQLLELCTFLVPDRIPEALLQDSAAHWPAPLQQAVAEPLLFQQLIADLFKFSLVKRLAEERALAIHRLVQAVQRDRMEQERQRYWVERATLAVYDRARKRFEEQVKADPYTDYTKSQARETAIWFMTEEARHRGFITLEMETKSMAQIAEEIFNYIFS